MRDAPGFGRAGRSAALAVAAIALLAILAAQGATAAEVTKRMERDIRIVEDLLDDVLIDSPYWLVSSGGGLTHGFYLEGYGAVFEFQASLVAGRSGSIIDLRGLRRLKDYLGGHITIEYDDQEEETYGGDDDQKADRLHERRLAREKRDYDRGKQELREALLDLGPTLEELGSDEWVALLIDLGSRDYFRKEKLSRLIIKARVGDLSQYEAGHLTADQAMERIVEVEY
jgi:hypothetical protein